MSGHNTTSKMEVLSVKTLMWTNGSWVVGIEDCLARSSPNLRIFAYRPTRSNYEPVVLFIRITGHNSEEPTVEVTDLDGRGSSLPEYRGVGIGHVMVNLAIEYLTHCYGERDPLVKGLAFHGDSPLAEDQARRERFIKGFGVLLHVSGEFSVRLSKLTVRHHSGLRDGLPGDLTLDQLKPVDKLPP